MVSTDWHLRQEWLGPLNGITWRELRNYKSSNIYILVLALTSSLRFIVIYETPYVCYLYLHSILTFPIIITGFPGGASGKEPTCHCRRQKGQGSIPVLGRSPGGGCGNPLQYSCLENRMDRGAWRATVHGVKRVRQDLGHTHTSLLLVKSKILLLLLFLIFNLTWESREKNWESLHM